MTLLLNSQSVISNKNSAVDSSKCTDTEICNCKTTCMCVYSGKQKLSIIINNYAVAINK